MSARQALAQDVEVMEFETPAGRQEMFRELARTSQQQAQTDANEAPLFAVLRDGRLVPARPIDPRADLLQAPDAGAPFALRLDGADRWPDARRDALQGLSEREAAELVARTLLSNWGVPADKEILVDRAPGAPYAVAYVDGVLRVNPAFLFMAAAVSPSSVQTPLQ